MDTCTCTERRAASTPRGCVSPSGRLLVASQYANVSDRHISPCSRACALAATTRQPSSNRVSPHNRHQYLECRVSPRTRGTVERSTRPQYSRVPRTSTTAGVCRSRRGEATRWRFVATGAGPSASLPEPPVAMSMPTCAGTLEHGGLTAWQGNIPGGPSSLGSTQAWAGASAAPIQARHHLHPLAIRNPQLGGRPRVLSLKPRAGGTLDEGVSRSYRCDS
jgi:hypothetical protein